MKAPRRQSALTLIGWIALCIAAGGLGSFAAIPKLSTWYARLAKPSWNPPDWVFGPVWTALYVLMGIAAWLVWRAWAQRASYAAGTAARKGLRWFAIQLGLNVAWPFLFFGWERVDAALVEIAFLWIAIAGTSVFFRRVQPVAAWLLMPYLVWVSFAMCLNFAIWRLNA